MISCTGTVTLLKNNPTSSSSAQYTISDHWAHLGHDIVEAIEYLKLWFKEEVSYGHCQDRVIAERMMFDSQIQADELQL
jgi:hypothetical protein